MAWPPDDEPGGAARSLPPLLSRRLAELKLARSLAARVATLSVAFKDGATVFRRIFIVVSFFGFGTAITFTLARPRAPRARGSAPSHGH